MKKKLLAIALVVALLAVAVGGTLAYFTDQDAATNTFTVGSVKIEIYENDVQTEGDVVKFGPLTPIVNVDQPSADVSYIGKAVEVKNTGNNGAYVRVHIAVPTKLAYNYLCLDMDTEGWSRVSNSVAVVGGVEYEVLTYDYDTAVAPGAFTPELLKGVYLASDVDLLDDGNGNLEFIRRLEGGYIDESDFIAHTLNADGTYTSASVNVLVAAQAIQVDGFSTDVEKPATAALNSGFAGHPWPVE